MFSDSLFSTITLRVQKSESFFQGYRIVTDIDSEGRRRYIELWIVSDGRAWGVDADGDDPQQMFDGVNITETAPTQRSTDPLGRLCLADILKFLTDSLELVVVRCKGLTHTLRPDTLDHEYLKYPLLLPQSLILVDIAGPT